MTTREDQAIPYEKQAEGPANRMCGAAALSMVYRSLDATRSQRGQAGLGDVSQDAIWARISKADRAGGLNCATHLMVKDALGRGLAAVALQASDPLQMLLACRANGIHAILNHRLRPDSPAGHYTVLVGMDEAGVTVHDPSAGPSQRIPFGQLLELWQPRPPGSEIVGNVLIAIADDPPRLERCTACSVPIPAEAPCPQCKAGVPLAPSALVGCVGASCVNRSWLRDLLSLVRLHLPLRRRCRGGATGRRGGSLEPRAALRPARQVPGPHPKPPGDRRPGRREGAARPDRPEEGGAAARGARGDRASKDRRDPGGREAGRVSRRRRRRSGRRRKPRRRLPRRSTGTPSPPIC